MQKIDIFDITNQEAGNFMPLNQDLFNDLETVSI